jgi:methylenetetrahydrofolate dehydrogenase (NADP+) / methenyltetrahydrofolate cyclohydrolase
MTTLLLDGRGAAKELRAELQQDMAAFKATYGFAPCLVVVQVAGDPATERYVRAIRKLCDALGAVFRLELLPATATQSQLATILAALSADIAVHGILLQQPLPATLVLDQALEYIDYRKDVDGAHPTNAGRLMQGRAALVPNTPAGGMALLRRYGIDPAGMRAAVVGRSPVVGRPMALLLLQANATVTICHSRTPDLAAVLRECDLVAAAAGRPGLITADMLRPGAIVVDFGINVQADGSMTGDVDFAAASEIAGAITPVPGGTGPVTNIMLLRNLLLAAREQLGADPYAV